MFNAVLIIVSVLLIISVLLQQKNAGSSAIFGSGAGGSDNIFQTRRGPEKFFFILTIILSIVFIGLAFFRLVF